MRPDPQLTTSRLLGAILVAAALAVLPASFAVEVARPVKTFLLLGGLAIVLPLAAWRGSAARIQGLGGAGFALVVLSVLSAAGLATADDIGLAQERLALLVIAAGAYFTIRLSGSSGVIERAMLGAGVAVAVLGLLTLGPLRAWIPSVDAGAATFGTRNLAAGFVALVLPLAWGRPRAFVPLAVYIALSGNRLGLLAGAVACLALFLRDAQGTKALLRRSAAALGILVLVGVRMPSLDSTTVRERLHLWSTTVSMAQERPTVGVGAGQWQVHYPRAAESDAASLVRPDRIDHGPEGFVTVRGFRQPAHAHQDFLEIWAELGTPGLVALIAACLFGLVPLLSEDPARRRAAAGVLAFAVSSCGSFPLSEPVSACVFGALLAAGTNRASASTRIGQLRFTALAAGATCLVLVPRFGLGLMAERNLRAGIDRTLRCEFEAAEEELRLGAELAKQDFRFPLYLGFVHASARQTGAAIEATEAALRARPWSPNAWNSLGLLLRREGRNDEAERALRTAHRFLPGDIHVNANLGALLLARGDAASARPHFERVVTENPNVFQAWEGLAECAFQESEHLAGLTYLEAARDARLRCDLAVRSRTN